MLVYTAGKYRGDVDKNIDDARKVAIDLWEMGYVVICPHLNTDHFENDCKVIDDVYLKGDLEIILRCDAMVMIPGWRDSSDACAEYDFALRHDIPIYEYPILPHKSPTEKLRPIQCNAFLSTIMKMYRVHLSKNHDYSPANILATGEIGLVTRLWDKIARLLNLTGFRFTVQYDGFQKPEQPRHESIDDTLMDAAVYSIIGILLRKDSWGK